MTLIVLGGAALPREGGLMSRAWPIAAGLGAVVVFAVAGMVSTRSKNPFQVAIGKDRRPASSKLQLVLWTWAAAFSYAALLVHWGQVSGSLRSVTISIPADLGIALGLSVGNAVAAKGITVGYVANGRILKPKAQAGRTAEFVVSDTGEADFVKIQMLGWNVLAVGVYLYRVWEILGDSKTSPAGDYSLPDIDASLVVLTGIGNGAYLGKKLVNATAARLSGLQPSASALPVPMTITGTGFGTGDGSAITFDDMPAQVAIRSWQDERIEFTAPGVQSDGTRWNKGQRVEIGLVVGGRKSANTLPFTVV